MKGQKSKAWPIDVDQHGPSHEGAKFKPAQGGVTSGRAALAEPLQLLGICAVSAAFHDQAMATFLYRCPKTRLRVQGWVADEPNQPEKLSYEAVTCLACGGVHLVNPASGRTIDDGENPG
jgi:hypothetical protein